MPEAINEPPNAVADWTTPEEKNTNLANQSSGKYHYCKGLHVEGKDLLSHTCSLRPSTLNSFLEQLR